MIFCVNKMSVGVSLSSPGLSMYVLKGWFRLKPKFPLMYLLSGKKIRNWTSKQDYYI